MSDSKAEKTSVGALGTKGEVICPHCGGVDAYERRQAE